MYGFTFDFGDDRVTQKKQIPFRPCKANLGEKGTRPEISKSCPISLKYLIEHCWMQEPDKRITLGNAKDFLQHPAVENNIKNHS